MLKASSLFYAIAISILFALISSSLILFSHFNRIEFGYNLQMQRIQLNAVSGINFLLSKQDVIKLNEKKVIDLFAENEDEVFLERKSWGAFEIAISRAVWKKDSITQIAQVGYGIPKGKQFSIYLADNDKPLSLCGFTKIKGLCYLPKAGVERAYIEGQSFSGEKLIDGEIKKSEKKLPPINEELVKSLALLCSIADARNTTSDSIIYMEDINKNENVKNSFEKRSIYIYSKNKINLRGNAYEGNIIIVSDKEIKIASDAQLHDIIVMAPKIEIEEKFTGNIQAYARDTLVVKKRCQLNYPSVIGVIRKEHSFNNILLKVEEGASLDGLMFGYQENIGVEKQLLIQIEKDAKITGQIYSNGSVDLKGSIYGSVVCDKFMLGTPSSVYENHLLNATIDNTKLSANFVSSSLLEQSENKKLVKWLY